MSGFDYFKHGLTKRFADFEGRSRRSEYWYFVLFSTIISYSLMLIPSFFGSTMAMIGSGLYFIWAIAVLIPSLAVGVRRLHDTNKSGWWLLIALIPILGAIALLVFLASDGDVGKNQYGHDPKRQEENDVIVDNLV